MYSIVVPSSLYMLCPARVMSLECVEWECEITVLSEYSFLPGFGGGRNLYAGALSI